MPRPEELQFAPAIRTRADKIDNPALTPQNRVLVVAPHGPSCVLSPLEGADRAGRRDVTTGLVPTDSLFLGGHLGGTVVHMPSCSHPVSYKSSKSKFWVWSRVCTAAFPRLLPWPVHVCWWD